MTEAENQADTEKHIRFRRMCRKVYQEDKETVLAFAIGELVLYSLDMTEGALTAVFRICLVFPIQTENLGNALDNKTGYLADIWNMCCTDWFESLTLADSDMVGQA